MHQNNVISLSFFSVLILWCLNIFSICDFSYYLNCNKRSDGSYWEELINGVVIGRDWPFDLQAATQKKLEVWVSLRRHKPERHMQGVRSKRYHEPTRQTISLNELPPRNNFVDCARGIATCPGRRPRRSEFWRSYLGPKWLTNSAALLAITYFRKLSVKVLSIVGKSAPAARQVWRA